MESIEVRQLFTLLDNCTKELSNIQSSEKDKINAGLLNAYDSLLKQLVMAQTLLNQAPFQSKDNVQIIGSIIAQLASRKNSVDWSLNALNSKLPQLQSTVMLGLFQKLNDSIAAQQNNLMKMSEDAAKGLGGADEASDLLAEVTRLGGTYIPVEELAYTFNDIFGNEETKQKMLLTSVDPKSRPPILFGPPGSGKNVMLMAFAKIKNFDLIMFTSANILSGTQGQSEKNVQDVIRLSKLAVEHGALIVIDEVDQIFQDRSQVNLGAPSVGLVINTALTNLELYADYSQSLAFTTNYLSSIDAAIRRRLEPVFIDYPYEEDAVNNYRFLLGKFNVADFDTFDEHYDTIIKIFREKRFLSTATVVNSIRATFRNLYKLDARVKCGISGLDQNREYRENACFIHPDGESTVGEIATTRPGTPVYVGAVTMDELIKQLSATSPSITEEEYKRYRGVQ